MDHQSSTGLQHFKNLVGIKFQLYNGLFTSLPFHRIEKTGILLSLLQNNCEEGYRKKQSPIETLNTKLKEKELDDARHRHMGTNAGEALRKAFAMKPDTIFFISDGEPTGTSGDDVIKEVAQLQKTLPRPAKIHVISYVPDEGQAFMQGLARANGGEYRVVNLNETGK